MLAATRLRPGPRYWPGGRAPGPPRAAYVSGDTPEPTQHARRYAAPPRAAVL